jgi:hypothetical protein
MPGTQGSTSNFNQGTQFRSRGRPAIDINKETPATRELYGIDDDVAGYFGRQALMARRLVERGVRYVHVSRLGALTRSDAATS